MQSLGIVTGYPYIVTKFIIAMWQDCQGPITCATTSLPPARHTCRVNLTVPAMQLRSDRNMPRIAYSRCESAWTQACNEFPTHQSPAGMPRDHAFLDVACQCKRACTQYQSTSTPCAGQSLHLCCTGPDGRWQALLHTWSGQDIYGHPDTWRILLCCWCGKW